MASRESIFRTGDHGEIPVILSENGKKSKLVNSASKKRVADEDIAPEVSKQRAEKKAKRIARKEAIDEEKLKIIHVGIDFGTTYSGVSWITGHESAKGDAEVLDQWPEGGRSEKVPTRIAYASENTCIKDGIDKFGFEVTSDMKGYWWFKLGLDKVAEPTAFDDPLMEEAVGRGLMQCAAHKSHQEMAADFLRYMYQNTLIVLSRRVGPAALTLTAMVFHITLPAAWSHKARDATRMAAIDAGFGSRPHDKIMLTDEPEAAMICAIKTNAAAFQERSVIKKGACVVVADLGGGTCDLTSFKINSPWPLQTDEACVGAGAKCGGTTIDRHLHKLMARKYDIAFTGLEDRLKGPGSAFMEKFEKVKHKFNLAKADDDEACYSLPLKMRKLDPGAKGYDFTDDTVMLTGKELASMFDDVLRPTLELVDKQVEGVKSAKMGAVKAIILCGGLGESSYVESRFSEYAKTKLNGAVEVIAPNRAWSAITRGAALSGLDKPAVTYRRSRCFIGIPLNHAFDSSRHTEEESFVDEVTGKKQAANQMEWIVHRGDPIRPTTKETIICFADIPSKGHGKLVMTQPIYSCVAEKAPQRLSDAEVNLMNTVSIDLTDIAADARKKARANKSEKSKLPKSIEIRIDFKLTPYTDKGMLLIVATHRGKVTGETKIEYEADPTYECRQARLAKRQLKAKKAREQSQDEME